MKNPITKSSSNFQVSKIEQNDEKYFVVAHLVLDENQSFEIEFLQLTDRRRFGRNHHICEKGKIHFFLCAGTTVKEGYI